jgi:hypothetical protein
MCKIKVFGCCRTKKQNKKLLDFSITKIMTTPPFINWVVWEKFPNFSKLVSFFVKIGISFNSELLRRLNRIPKMSNI